MKKFLEDLKKELQKRNLSSEDIEEILADHEEMIQSALAQGLSEEELNSRFGDPVSLADELADTSAERVEAKQAKYDDYQLYKTFLVKSVDLSIESSLVSENITYQASEDDSIKVYYQGKSKIDDYEISYQGNVLKIAAPKKIGFLFMRNIKDDLNFIVEVPKTSIIKEFTLKGVSSNLKVLNLDSKDFVLSTTSGDVTLTNVKLGTAKWNTVSGDIHVSQSQIETLTSSQVSGDLFMNHVVVLGNIRLSTVSGDVKAENATGKICEFSSVSGDLKGIEFYPTKLTLKSVSGDVTIHNQSEDKKIEDVKSKSVSGKVVIKN
ncbi:MAG: DUF4097 family beta strand repeat-containing protein [Acholeplasmataceae bacterium]|nr:DUF4097 family beta strand repeat-containing protein [Acholeplasmataceae bacterium]